MDTQDLIWLAADYHLPITYSCPIPMSSSNSALAMPAPGPGTVRLAMIRSGIELFGENYVRDELYPIIRAAEIYIKPPAKVAISSQFLRLFKGDKSNLLSGDGSGSPAYREFCHAQGLMTVYLKIPKIHADICHKTLEGIGYWGQANSFACCVDVKHNAPQLGECAMPFASLPAPRPTQSFFSCLVSDFRDKNVSWEEILPTLEADKFNGIQLAVYVWPLIIIGQQSNRKLLVRCSLN